jgi:hypothetical protein
MGEQDEVIEYNTERWGEAALYNRGSDGEGEVGETRDRQAGSQWRARAGRKREPPFPNAVMPFEIIL